MLTWGQFLALRPGSAGPPSAPSDPPCLSEPFSSGPLTSPARSLLRPPASSEPWLSEWAATQGGVVFVWCRHILLRRSDTEPEVNVYTWSLCSVCVCLSSSSVMLSSFSFLSRRRWDANTVFFSLNVHTRRTERKTCGHVNIFPICPTAKKALNKILTSSLLSWRRSAARCWSLYCRLRCVVPNWSNLKHFQSQATVNHFYSFISFIFQLFCLKSYLF